MTGPDDASQERISDQFREEADRIAQEFESKIRDLEAKAASAKGRATERDVTPKLSPEKQTSSSSLSANRGLAFGLQLSYTLVGVPIAFFGVGWLIDRSRGGNTWQTWLGLIGFGIAVAYTITLLNRQNAQK